MSTSYTKVPAFVDIQRLLVKGECAPEPDANERPSVAVHGETLGLRPSRPPQPSTTRWN
jgi:hypothetical protein